MMRRWCCIRHCVKGGVAVEFALMVPMLVFTMLAMVDFVHLMSEDGRIANAALAGVHYGMQSAAHAADEDGMVRAARTDAGRGAEELEIVAQQSCSCATGKAVLCTLSCEDNAKPLMLVKVSVSRDYKTMLPYPMIGNPVPLYREAEVQVQ